jgi:hypothetical protein
VVIKVKVLSWIKYHKPCALGFINICDNKSYNAFNLGVIVIIGHEL